MNTNDNNDACDRRYTNKVLAMLLSPLDQFLSRVNLSNTQTDDKNRTNMILDHDTELLLMEDSDMDLMGFDGSKEESDDNSDLLLKEANDLLKHEVMTTENRNREDLTKSVEEFNDEEVTVNIDPDFNINDEELDASDEESKMKPKVKRKLKRHQRNHHKDCLMLREMLPDGYHSMLPTGWIKKVYEGKPGKLTSHFYSPQNIVLRSKRSLEKLLTHDDMAYIYDVKVDDFDFCPFDAGVACPKNKPLLKRIKKSLIQENSFVTDVIEEKLAQKYVQIKEEFVEKDIETTRETLDECKKLKRTFYKFKLNDLLFKKQYKALREIISLGKIKSMEEIDQMLRGEMYLKEFDNGFKLDEHDTDENIVKVLVKAEAFLDNYCQLWDFESKHIKIETKKEEDFGDNSCIEQNNENLIECVDLENEQAKYEDNDMLDDKIECLKEEWLEDEETDQEELLLDAAAFLAFHGLMGIS